MGIPYAARQGKRFSVGDQHHIPELDLPHTVLHRFDRLIQIHAGHCRQRDIGQFQFTGHHVLPSQEQPFLTPPPVSHKPYGSTASPPDSASCRHPPSDR